MVSISDGNGGSDTITVNVTINAVDDAPVITEGVSTSVNMSEDSNPNAFSLTLNASDIDNTGSQLTWSISSQATHGTATATGTGLSKSIGYTPNLNHNGSDSFVVRVSDGTLADTITVNVTIDPRNDAPVCVDVPLVIPQDTPGSVVPGCSDVDGDSLSFSIVTNASHGTANAGINILNYTPNAGYIGPDSFTYRANDGLLNSNTSTVNVTVNHINHAPVITEGAITSVTMSEDGLPTAFSLTLNATDTDGDSLTWSISSGAGHGTATASGVGTSKAIGYSPTANYNGSDSFVVMVSDGNGGSDTITVNVTIDAVNDVPVCAALPLSTAEDTMGEISPSCTDADGETLTYSIVGAAGHGSASVVAGKLRYTPSANYNGGDSFTYKANDTHADSNTAAVTVTVSAVNDVPVCAALPLSTAEDTMGEISPSCTDADGETLTYSIVGAAGHGSASVVAGKLRYIPSANYNGGDSFTYKANDTHADSNIAAVTVTVSAVNDAPVCAALPLSTAEDTMGEISPSCTDADGDPLSYSIVGSAVNGTASVVSGKLRYVPNANFNGGDSFTYKANDTHVDSNTAAVTVTVSAVNDAPVCAALPLSTAEDTMNEISPSCTDVDTGDVLTYSIVGAASHGSASVVSGKLRYTPTANYNGGDSFTYKANDTHVDSNTAAVTVTVSAVNDAPVCAALPLSTAEDTMGEVSPSCTDADGNPLTYEVGLATHGATSVVSGNLRYTPTANYNGGDTFTYRAYDGIAFSANATVTVTVTAVNDAPVCNAVSITTNEDTLGQIAASCNDVDGNPLTYSAGVAVHGTTSVASNMLRYTPQANYHGADSFTYKANDGTVDSNSPSVSVTVNSINDAPVIAESDPVAVSMSENGAPVAFALTLNASDIDGDPISWNISTPAAHGTAGASGTGLSKAITYSPNTNYSGADSFVVRVSDGIGGIDTLTVNVTISEVFLTISGNAGEGEAELSFFDRTAKQVEADGTGAYSLQVHYNWSGTVTPSKEGFTFSPPATSYTSLHENQAGQNYTASAITFSISGNAGVGGAVLTYPGGVEVADPDGEYEIGISYAWNGVVTPALSGYTFFPGSREYIDVLGDQIDQNFEVRTPADLYKVLSKRPIFIWPKVTADKYQLQVSAYSNFQSNLLDKMPAGNSYLPVADLPTGKYLYWRYRPIVGTTPGDWSPVWSFIIPPPTLSAPILTAPAISQLTKENDINFGWKTVLGGTKYELLISKSSKFTTVEKDIVNLNPVEPLSLNMSNLVEDLTDAKYYWKVRAYNALNVPGKWSTSRNLTVDTTAPLPPVLKLPAADAIVVGTPTYSWNSSAGANRYQFGYDPASCDDPAYKSVELSTTSVKPPTQPQGIWFWCVRAKDAAGNWSPWASARRITVNPAAPAAPTLIAPVNALATKDSTPDFSWNSVVYGNQYEIQISQSSTFATIKQSSLRGPGVLAYTADSLPDGKYYWRVRAVNTSSTPGSWSAVRNFTVDTISPTAPVLKLPANGATAGGIPTYSWNTSAGATKYQFGYDPANCVDPVNKSAILAVTSHKPASQPTGTWNWCVRAGDSADNWSGWSERTITINPVTPVAPILVSPTSSTISGNPRPLLSWNGVLYGDRYQVQVSVSSMFTSPVKDSSGSSTNYSPDTDLPDGKYYWRVRAINDSLPVNGPWSAVRTFTVDTTAPVAPVLKLPLNLAAIAGTPTYSWNASSGAATYRFVYGAASCDAPIFASGWMNVLSFKPPTQPAGPWTWCVQAKDAAGNISLWSSRSITVNLIVPVAPVLVLPVNAALTGDSTPNFSWNSVPYGDTYQIQISKVSNFASTEQDVTGGAGVIAYTATTLLDGKYYWRVRAINSLSAGPWSAARNFTVDTTPPLAPTLKTPLDKSVSTVIPTYAWNSTLGANRYQFRYDTHSDCASPVFESGELTLTSYKPVGQSYGTYFWCVSARDAAGNWSAWSVPNKLILTPF